MEAEIARMILDKLERMEARLDVVHFDLVDVNGRLACVANGMDVVVHRLDRLDGRLGRIEQRLEVAV